MEARKQAFEDRKAAQRRLEEERRHVQRAGSFDEEEPSSQGGGGPTNMTPQDKARRKKEQEQTEHEAKLAEARKQAFEDRKAAQARMEADRRARGAAAFSENKEAAADAEQADAQSEDRRPRPNGAEPAVARPSLPEMEDYENGDEFSTEATDDCEVILGMSAEEQQDMGDLIHELDDLLVQDGGGVDSSNPESVEQAMQQDALEEYLLNAEEDEASTHHRIEELRLHLETELGMDRFLAAYRYLKDDEGDDNFTENISALLGTDQVAMFGVICQLLACEEKIYGT